MKLYSRSIVKHKSSAHAFAFAFQSLVQPASFHHSSLQLSVQFAAPVFPSPYYFVRRFINRSGNNLVSPPALGRRAILFFATATALPRWSPLVPPGRRVSFILQAHISTLISRMVIHRSHQPGLVSARSSSSSASPFCFISLSRARVQDSLPSFSSSSGANGDFSLTPTTLKDF